MKKLKTFEAFNKEQNDNIDEILDKMNDKGIDSLSEKELDILKNMGIKPNPQEIDDPQNDEEVYSKKDLDDFGLDWLQRRTAARKLYNVEGNNPADIGDHLIKIIDFLDDDKNADAFKSNVIKEYTKELNKLVDNEDDEENVEIYLEIIQMLEKKLSIILGKYGKN